MKNIIAYLFLPFLISCGVEDDARPCCSRPYKYSLSLFFSEKSDEVTDILVTDTLNSDSTYFYYLQNQDTIKIRTGLYSGYYGDESSDELFFAIYSEAESIYEPFVDKGLTTVYLRKLNNKTDTIQFKVSIGDAEVGRFRTRYVIDATKINNKNAVVLNDFGGDGYYYWLRNP